MAPARGRRGGDAAEAPASAASEPRRGQGRARGKGKAPVPAGMGTSAASDAPRESFPGSPFKLASRFKPTGDQPEAIKTLVAGLEAGEKMQTLLGVTGSGKTFTIANVIARHGRPTLVISHNKTLAAQLYEELSYFFPDNAVRFFVSYYDYYQPEAYVPSSDTYIAKETSVNEEIERLRHAATAALLTREDTIVVASVSCIYGLGDPHEYGKQNIPLAKSIEVDRDEFLKHLVDIHYKRNNIEALPGTFRVRGDTVEVHQPGDEEVMRLEFWGDTLERIAYVDPVTGNTLRELDGITIFPAKHFVMPEEEMDAAIARINEQLEERLSELRTEGKVLEAARLEQRTRYDMEMLKEIGYCSGVENYSQPLSGRPRGSAPWTLLDYFPDNYLMVIDESHATVPQIRGMFNGDQARKQTLVMHGFRLPSALDNRPLRFEEFEERVPRCIFTSATPGPYERRHSARIAEQLIRPTGLIDPEIEVRPQRGQVDDLLAEIRERSKVNERVLVTTLTKRMAEDLTEYYDAAGVKVEYLHSDIHTLDRVLILDALRRGEFEAIVGINLLREGLDLPEVSLVAILDADKYGFLRSETALIQTIGRAARNVHGKVVMYANDITPAMKIAIDTTNERRRRQQAYNAEHGITPQSTVRAVRAAPEEEQARTTLERLRTARSDIDALSEKEKERLIAELTRMMKEAARNLEFEKAALLRDELIEIKRKDAV